MLSIKGSNQAGAHSVHLLFQFCFYHAPVFCVNFFFCLRTVFFAPRLKVGAIRFQISHGKLKPFPQRIGEFESFWQAAVNIVRFLLRKPHGISGISAEIHLIFRLSVPASAGCFREYALSVLFDCNADQWEFIRIRNFSI